MYGYCSFPFQGAHGGANLPRVSWMLAHTSTCTHCGVWQRLSTCTHWAAAWMSKGGKLVNHYCYLEVGINFLNHMIHSPKQISSLRWISLIFHQIRNSITIQPCVWLLLISFSKQLIRPLWLPRAHFLFKSTIKPCESILGWI